MNVDEAERIWEEHPGPRAFFFIDDLTIVHSRMGMITELGAWDGINAEVTVEEMPRRARSDIPWGGPQPMEGVLGQNVFFTEIEAVEKAISFLEARINNITKLIDHHRQRLEQIS